MKSLVIIQPSFMPWLGYFDLIQKSNYFIFYDHVQFDKNSWRNRNRILTNKNKIQWITLPVKGGNLKKKINEIEIFEAGIYQKKIIRIE